MSYNYSINTQRPRDIAVDRAAGRLTITWQDHHVSEYVLRWLRANCPCATCREERRVAALETDLLTLSSGPLPSTQIAGAELVGNYAIRLRWTDGHDTGIYTFGLLRAVCPCTQCHPAGPPTRLLDE
ncbi:MAG: DUF971 domain-containing protein [Caldilineaceae bacterium]|nr:DUF971 domain-containing protein [Caldilineaceae bacterium]